MDRGLTSPEFYRSPPFWDFIDFNFESLQSPMAASVVFATRLCDSAYHWQPEAATVRLGLLEITGRLGEEARAGGLTGSASLSEMPVGPGPGSQVRLRVLLTSDYSLTVASVTVASSSCSLLSYAIA